MAKTTAKAVETRGLSEMLAGLRQATQDTGAEERAPQGAENPRIAPELPATHQGGKPALKSACAWVLLAVLCAGGIAAGVYTKDAVPPVAAGDAVSSAERQAQARLVGDFSGFAGSDANARSLAAGLRYGSEIILTAPAAGGQPATATRFVPPTRSMDYGNVRITLVLAREQLAQLGVSRPTPAQIKAVLAGGGIASRGEGRAATPFLLPGVLQMRAGGMGWTKIADTMGLTLEQAMNGRAHREGVAVPPDSRRLAAPSVEGATIAVATARGDVGAPQRAGVTPAAISSAPAAKSPEAAARTAAVAKAAAPLRRSAIGEPGPEARHSGANVVAAVGGSPAEVSTVTTPAQGGARGTATGSTAAAAPAPTDDLVGSEEGQTAE